MNAASLAIIGGGRWGRVHRAVAEKSGLPLARLVTVSRHGGGELPSLEALLADPPTAAIVANAARDHFATACALLEAGVHVLVEKPIVLQPEEMELLQQRADQASLCLMPGLNYRFCSYLDQFARVLLKYGHSHALTLHWADSRKEVRYGEMKIRDYSISIADDIMPHIWTVLAVLFPGQNFAVIEGRSMRQGLEAYFALRSDTHTAVVQLDREAPVRQRLITVANERQATLALDFTCEPGTITSGAITYSGDESWREKPSPLTQQLHHFFACIARGQTTKADREALSCSVNFSHAAAQRLSCPPSSAA